MEHFDREIFLRHYYYCQPVKTIAAELEMNESTVKTRLKRGREKLKTILREGGYLNEP
jgi:RNA polymerase sigma-70 factor (ECF subfamily)